MSYSANSGYGADVDQKTRKVKDYYKRNVTANIIGALSAMPLIVPIGLLPFLIITATEIEEKLCEGTSTRLSGGTLNYCAVPIGVNEVKVTIEASYKERITTYLFDHEPEVSENAHCLVDASFNGRIWSSDTYGAYIDFIVRGSNVTYSLYTSDDQNAVWYWAKASTIEEAKKNPIISESGNVFNMSYSINETGYYGLFVDVSNPRRTSTMRIKGTYTENFTTFKYTDANVKCTDVEECIFKETSGKYIIALNNHTSVISVDNEIIIGKDYSAALPTLIGISVVMVVCLCGGIAMIIISCCMKSQVEELKKEVDDIINFRPPVTTTDTEMPPLGTTDSQTPGGGVSEPPPTYAPSGPDYPNGSLPQTSDYVVSPY